MANFSDQSRKEQVLTRLQADLGEWVDGVELANEKVGGSEGLKRKRELEAEGWLIQKRQKPDSDQWQYRLVVQEGVDGPTSRVNPPPQEKPNDDRPVDDGGAAAHSSAPHPAQSTWMDPKYAATRDTLDLDWKPVKKSRNLEHTFRFDGNQRAVGAIAKLDDGRWVWGLIIPANRAMGTPNKQAGHGVEPSKVQAIGAIEALVRQMRRERGERV